MKTIKTIARTFMFIVVVLFCITTVHYYKIQAQATLPTKPDFEHTNNQQFLDNVIQCVNYIEHNTTDIYPVNLELLLAQAALESGWGNSRFALEGNAIFGQWTWTGQGIEPLNKGKHEGHKILRFNSLYLFTTNKNQLKFLIDF